VKGNDPEPHPKILGAAKGPSPGPVFRSDP
jgi:hypothetical protein